MVAWLGLLALLPATASDLRNRTIPNSVSYSLILGGLAFAIVQPLLPSQAAWLAAPTPASAVAGCLACGSAMFAAYLALAIGGGDVKLLCGVGAVYGLTAGVSIMLWSHILAAAAALVLIGWQAAFKRGLRRPLRHDVRLPLAPFVLLASAMVATGWL